MPREQIKKLAILAGAGNLPVQVMNACKRKNINYCIVGFEDETDFQFYENEENLHRFKVYSISKIINKLKELEVSHICLAGKVKRSDLARLLLDMKGAKLLTLMVKSGLADNSLLVTILNFIEKEGFSIVSPDSIASEIVIQKGCITKAKPDKSALQDIKLGLKVLKGIANFDVGQSLIIQGGLTLGVEAAEGTDELIKRCGEIRQSGDVDPIMVKIGKPNQDRRVDLPCIGVQTVENAFKYGIRGIAAEGGSTLVINQEATVKLANEYKIFIVGV